MVRNLFCKACLHSFSVLFHFLQYNIRKQEGKLQSSSLFPLCSQFGHMYTFHTPNSWLQGYLTKHFAVSREKWESENSLMGWHVITITGSCSIAASTTILLGLLGCSSSCLSVAFRRIREKGTTARHKSSMNKPVNKKEKVCRKVNEWTPWHEFDVQYTLPWKNLLHFHVIHACRPFPFPTCF